MGGKLAKSLTGLTIGYYRVIKEMPRRIYEERRYLCRCQCGNEKVVLRRSLVTGNTKSCGCLRDSQNRRANVKHLHTRNRKATKTYTVWRNMVHRCGNPNRPGYENYGGRGITVCSRWKGEHGFENFLADMGEKPEGLSLDRIDNDGNYEPSNCRWATWKQQNTNKRIRKDAKIYRTAKNVTTVNEVEHGGN